MPDCLSAILQRVALISALVCACLGSRGAWASDGGPTGLAVGVEAELVVQFEDLAGQLRRDEGAALRTMLGELGAFTRTRQAWEALSRSLGLSPQDAVDRLLGGRVFLLVEGAGSPGARWACAMAVDRELGRQIPKQLGAAPRETLEGRTVYAIEDGGFRVITVEGSDPGPSVLLLAPAGSESLLRAAVTVVSGWKTPARAARGGPAAVVLYRPTAEAWLSGTLDASERGWRLSFRASDALMGPAVGTPGVGLSESRFRALSEGAVVAFAGPAMNPSRAGAVGSAVSAWLTPDALIWTLLPIQPPPSFFGEGSDLAAVVVRSIGGGRLDCAFGFRVADLAGSVGVGDEHVCRVLGELSGSAGPGPSAPLCSGEYPEAVRKQSITVGSKPKRDLLGERLHFVWGTGGEDRGRGWWTLSASGPGSPSADIQEVLISGERSGGRSHAVAGLIRPAAALEMLGAPGNRAAGSGAAALRWVDLVEWHVDPSASKAAAWQGVVTVRMRLTP
jgi:hypothetical protein